MASVSNSLLPSPSPQRRPDRCSTGRREDGRHANDTSDLKGVATIKLLQIDNRVREPSVYFEGALTSPSALESLPHVFLSHLVLLSVWWSEPACLLWVFCLVGNPEPPSDVCGSQRAVQSAASGPAPAARPAHACPRTEPNREVVFLEREHKNLSALK